MKKLLLMVIGLLLLIPFSYADVYSEITLISNETIYSNINFPGSGKTFVNLKGSYTIGDDEPDYGPLRMHRDLAKMYDHYTGYNPQEHLMNYEENLLTSMTRHDLLMYEQVYDSYVLPMDVKINILIDAIAILEERNENMKMWLNGIIGSINKEAKVMDFENGAVKQAWLDFLMSGNYTAVSFDSGEGFETWRRETIGNVDQAIKIEIVERDPVEVVVEPEPEPEQDNNFTYPVVVAPKQEMTKDDAENLALSYAMHDFKYVINSGDNATVESSWQPGEGYHEVTVTYQLDGETVTLHLSVYDWRIVGIEYGE